MEQSRATRAGLSSGELPKESEHQDVSLMVHVWWITVLRFIVLGVGTTNVSGEIKEILLKV